MTRELRIEKQMSMEEIRALVAKAVCEKIELTPGDVEVLNDGTKIYCEHLIQERFARKEGFK